MMFWIGKKLTPATTFEGLV